MKLFELFDKTVEWEWEEQGRDAGSAVFPIGDVFYRTILEVKVPKNQPQGKQDLFLDVAFEAIRWDDPEDQGMSFDDVASDGNQYKVLSTVFQIVEQWFSQHGVMPIFAEATLKRKRIYTVALTRKGWTVEDKGSRIFAYPPGYKSKPSI